MHVSMSEAWEEAQAFVRREAALLLPLGFATLGLATLIYELVTPEPVEGPVQPGAWMFALIPVLALVLFGCVAISALVLRPRTSVAEAMRLAASRMGQVVLLLAAFIGAAALLIVVLSIAAVALGAVLRWGVLQSTILATVLAIPAIAWAGVRTLPLWALVADRGDAERAGELVRHCLAITRGGFWRLLGATLLFSLATLILSSAIQFGFGSLLLLLGRAVGNLALGQLLAAVLMAIVSTVLQTVWVVYVAVVYRRLEASRGM